VHGFKQRGGSGGKCEPAARAPANRSECWRAANFNCWAGQPPSAWSSLLQDRFSFLLNALRKRRLIATSRQPTNRRQPPRSPAPPSTVADPPDRHPPVPATHTKNTRLLLQDVGHVHRHLQHRRRAEALARAERRQLPGHDKVDDDGRPLPGAAPLALLAAAEDRGDAAREDVLRGRRLRAGGCGGLGGRSGKRAGKIDGCKCRHSWHRPNRSRHPQRDTRGRTFVAGMSYCISSPAPTGSSSFGTARQQTSVAASTREVRGEGPAAPSASSSPLLLAPAAAPCRSPPPCCWPRWSSAGGAPAAAAAAARCCFCCCRWRRSFSPATCRSSSATVRSECCVSV
jgi:hypothetical protein